MGLHDFSTLSQLMDVYTEDFTSQTSVAVTHSLGMKPVVWAEDGSGNVIDCEVVHNSANLFTVTFGASTSGTIHYR